MKKTILILVLGLIVLSLAKCSYSFYSAFADKPEYATKEILSQKYKVLIADVDKLILNSNSALSLTEQLKSVSYPHNIVFVNLTKQDHKDDDIVVKSLPLNGSKNTYVINGFGYGSIGSQEIVIITRPVKKHGIKNLELFLKYEAVN